MENMFVRLYHGNSIKNNPVEEQVRSIKRYFCQIFS